MKEVIYTPESPVRHPRRFIGAMFRDLVASRELALRLFLRDIRAMYRQSVLGYFWAFLPPLATTLTFSFLNSQNLINVGATPVAYPAYVLIGSLLWQCFLESLNCPMKALGAARAMLTKINFPREALVLGAMLELVFNLGIRLLLLVPLFLVYHIPMSTSLLLFPLGLVALIALGLSIGLWLAPIGMLYTDIGRGISLISGFWMLLTPVVYPPPASGIGAFLAKWNPVSPVLLTSRDWLIGQDVLHLAGFLLVTAIAVIALLVGWLVFRITMPMLVERMGG